MLCKEANNLRTSYRCATCGKVTCNSCSKQDPNSVNEMHRVHKNPEKCSKTRLSSQHFVCPHCEESFTTTAILQVHMAESHPEGFESVMGISQMSLTSNNSSQSIPYVPCKLCDKVFFIMKLILKITEAECMILENTSIYILVTNVALGPGMLKKAWNTEKP